MKYNKHVNETELTDVMLYRVHFVISGIRTHNVSGESTDCICNCKSNYHMITNTGLDKIVHVKHKSFH